MAHGDLVVRTDQEPATMPIMQVVGCARAAVGGGGNGTGERAIQSLEQQARVVKDALEARWGVRVAARFLDRFDVGMDWRMAFEFLQVRQAMTPGTEFGEAVLWKRRSVSGVLWRLSCLSDDGVFLGLRGSSGEMVAADVSGVWRARSVQRKPESEHWVEASAGLVR